jgi:hypothetical protein
MGSGGPGGKHRDVMPSFASAGGGIGAEGFTNGVRDCT